MPVTLSRFVATSALLLRLAVAESALAAPTKQECISTSETAQRLRNDGHLQLASALFLQCAADSCPTAIRADCLTELDSARKQLSAIRFIAMTSSGEPIEQLHISMDDRELSERDQNGRFVVDPGDHTFSISSVGYEKGYLRLVVASGDKARDEKLELVPISEETDFKPLLGYGALGVGVVGLGVAVILGLVAKSTYDDARSHCTGGPSACDAQGARGGATAHSQARIATVSAILGAGFVAGGILLVAPWKTRRKAQTGFSIGLGEVRFVGSW